MLHGSDLRIYTDAVKALLNRPELIDQLQSAQTAEATAKRLGISDEMADELRQLLLELPDGVRASSTDHQSEAGGSDPPSRLLNASVDSLDSAVEFMNTSFAQLRRAYHVLLTMSIATFVVGVAFLVIAAIRTFTHPGQVGSNAVIAGIGIVQIVTLFLRNPLRDVERAVAQAQRARVSVMSYMLGVGLIGESVYGSHTTKEQLDRLERLCDETLRRLDLQHRLDLPLDVSGDDAPSPSAPGTG